MLKLISNRVGRHFVGHAHEIIIALAVEERAQLAALLGCGAIFLVIMAIQVALRAEA